MKINSVKMIFGRIRKSLLARKFPAIWYICLVLKLGVAIHEAYDVTGAYYFEILSVYRIPIYSYC